jgi:hypothetical protein
MIPIADNASLGTDLDCDFKDLNRILHFYPTPPGLLGLDDPRLRDPRPMLPGSVTDESVSNHAAIVQSKLNLDGEMPQPWFAPDPNIDAPGPQYYATRGDRAEFLSRKGAPNGYAAVDNNLRLLPINVTQGAGLGTVSEVLFDFPEHFDVTNVVTGSVSSSEAKSKDIPDNSWFGTYGDIGMGPVMSSGLIPEFHVEQFPVELIPPLNGEKFTTGQFPPETLPVAKYGIDHGSGIVPDPGEFGDPEEYLARDMTYRHFDATHFYQPTVQSPTITVISVQGGTATITIRITLPGSFLFYRMGRPSFLECPPEFTVHVPLGTLIEAYSAKEGYKNSAIVSYVPPRPDVPFGSSAATEA